MDPVYPGIDYGQGIANRDPDTGIRYGVLPLHLVAQAWCDESEPNYGEVLCSVCGEEVVDWTMPCPKCGSEPTEMDYDPDNMEPYSWAVDKDGYIAESDDHGDIFILRSPYMTFGRYCSPCAPGAIDLSSPIGPIFYPDQDPPTFDYSCIWENRGYCFGHDWFESGRAPYPVYKASGDYLIRVYPEQNQFESLPIAEQARQNVLDAIRDDLSYISPIYKILFRRDVVEDFDHMWT